jgi:hypothetical protein
MAERLAQRAWTHVSPGPVDEVYARLLVAALTGITPTRWHRAMVWPERVLPFLVDYDYEYSVLAVPAHVRFSM